MIISYYEFPKFELLFKVENLDDLRTILIVFQKFYVGTSSVRVYWFHHCILSNTGHYYLLNFYLKIKWSKIVYYCCFVINFFDIRNVNDFHVYLLIVF